MAPHRHIIHRHLRFHLPQIPCPIRNSNRPVVMKVVTPVAVEIVAAAAAIAVGAIGSCHIHTVDILSRLKSGRGRGHWSEIPNRQSPISSCSGCSGCRTIGGQC